MKTMTRVAELHKKWLKDPGYKAAYDELEEEFTAAAEASRRQVGGQTETAEFRFVIVRRAPRDYGWQVIGPDGSPTAAVYGFSNRESARKAVAAFKHEISRAPITDAA
jgi:hypothetical protein